MLLPLVALPLASPLVALPLVALPLVALPLVALPLVALPLVALPLAAQYPLAPTPVFDPGSLTPAPLLSGYVTGRGTHRDDTTTFGLSRARLGIGARPLPFAAVKVQADLNAAALTDAFIQLTAPDTASRLVSAVRPALLMGQFRTPFSLDYNTSFGVNRGVNRALVVDRHSPRRELGVLGHVRVSHLGMLSAALLNGEGANQMTNTDGKLLASGRLTVIPIPGVAIAGKWAAEGADHRWGYDARIILPAELLILEGEAIKRNGPTGAAEIDAGGGYAQLAFKPVRWLQPVVKWERLRELSVTPTATTDLKTEWITSVINLIGRDEVVRFQIAWIAKSGAVIGGGSELIIQLHAVFQ